MDFDRIIDRKGSNSYKWDSRPDVPADTIPLWVADMDFHVCQPIMEALRKRVDHGVFGYTYVPGEYYEAIDWWFSLYHGWSIPREQVIYTSGVVPAISAIIKALASPGDKVLVQTPVYNCFFSSIRNNGCIVSESPLVVEGHDTYGMDFVDLEKRASDPLCKVMLLCNPHNPGGRVWTFNELERVAEICGRHGVVVVSDEIHCEITFPHHDYVPFALAAGDCQWVTCISPSKAFNTAGLQIANIVCPDEGMRKLIDKAININEVCDVNPFGVVALMASYSPEGRAWLDEMCTYVYDNYLYLHDVFSRSLPGMPVFRLEGTYLAWIDCHGIGIASEQLEEELIHKAHVWINAGSMYGAAGEGFIRINLACPRSVLEEGLRRLVPALAEYRSRKD